MKLVLVAVAAIFVLLLVFTAANWQVLTTPTPLSFVAFSVQGPLGIILLGVLVVVTALVVIYALLLRTSWLMESRKLNRQLEEKRELAEKAEASRITALQELLTAEFESLRATVGETGTASIARVEQAEQILARTIEETSNSLTAHIGYLDDKLKGGDTP
jgi:uncharacterized integral membrane protein